MSGLRSTEICPDMRLSGVTPSGNPAGSLSELRGIEGAAAHAYFSAIAQVIPPEFGFSGRVHHPAPDPVNALLSYGYGILYASVRRAVVRAGLSPFYGTLHASYKRQEALVYDLVEEYRQPVVDHVTLALIGRREVDPGSFSCEDGMCMIPPDLKKTYIAAILSRLSAQANYGGSRCEFSRIIEMQAEEMAECLLDEREYLPFRYHRL